MPENTDPAPEPSAQDQQPPAQGAQSGQGDPGQAQGAAPHGEQPPADPKPETDWKAEARKWEQRAKENSQAAKKLAEIEEAQKTAEQKATEAAQKAEQRAADALHRVASAEIRAALTGVVPDPAAVVEDLNLGRFVTADGDVDTDAVTALREKYAQLAPPAGPRAPAPNPAQGNSAPPKTLAEMIAEAEKSGDQHAVLRLKSRQLLQHNK